MRWLVAALLLAGALFAAVTVLKRSPTSDVAATDATAVGAGERDRVRRFWETYRRATQLRVEGRTAEAAAAYTEALALEPEHQDALYYLGNMQLDLGNLAAAEEAWRRLVEVDPSNARGHSQLGTLYSCVGEPALLDPARAAAEFQRALAINREETGPLLHLGEIALLQGDLTNASRYLDAVVGSNYTSDEAYFYQGYIAWNAGAPERAAALLATAARHARPTAPAPRASSEGDTRTGAAPLVRLPTTCRPMRGAVDALGRLDTAAVSVRVDSIYQAFDGLLRDVRRSVPR